MSSAPITEPDLVYIDASAFVKLVLDEPESDFLETYLTGLASPVVSSVLLRVEAIRAVRLGTGSPAALSEMRSKLDEISLVSVGGPTLGRAEMMDTTRLRTLDAIHLATALEVGAGEMLVYDRRLADAASAGGIVVLSPGA
jgi:uncharacterized protein